MNEPKIAINTATPMQAEKIVAAQTQALQTFTLDRPSSLNALDNEMCRALLSAIPRVARNPDVYIVALVSSSPKAFCAGGDVVALSAAAKSDIATAKSYMRDEYSLNWLLECFSKPTVSFIDGLCMGSGAGLSAFNTHRIAGENFKWAMPETKIGLFPDVGIARVLAKMPWPIGLYLGLTGRSIGRADAQWLRLVTHCISSSHFEDIRAKLADALPVDPLLDDLNQPQVPGDLQKERGHINEHFSEPTLDGIFRSLERAEAKGSEWAQRTLSGLRKCSPISLAITLRHIQNALRFDIRDTLIEDYRLAVRCLENHDFHEGVRALLRDKDGKPVWQPARYEDVAADIVEGYFKPLPEGDLELPSRVEMQAARV
ncbi:enoyl-CoA hydratase/isomerase family protein [Hyphomicrobium sp. B1]|uniref:enoyl-CoA hydratase/isomerase family protein n=1 Tax=Hyphomicrobium sp. B1 TaxID=3075651 RepID=UPI003C309A56